MKLVTVVFAFICLLVTVHAQFFDDFRSFGGSFSGGLDAPLQAARDPRQNTGPVVFPASPGDNGETSGVVAGASGYGFVPPSANAGPRQGGF